MPDNLVNYKYYIKLSMVISIDSFSEKGILIFLDFIFRNNKMTSPIELVSYLLMSLLLFNYFFPFLIGLVELAKVVWKGTYYFTENLGPLTEGTNNKIVCKTLLPGISIFGLILIPTFSIAVINGPDTEKIVEILDRHDSDFRMPLKIFDDIITGFNENKTDAHFFLHSTPESLIHRNRSLIKYIHNSERLENFYEICLTGFKSMLKTWKIDGTYQSIDYNFAKVGFDAFGKAFFGLDNMNFDNLYKMNKALEYALNNGRPCSNLFYKLPDCLKFLMPAQKLTYDANKIYASVSKELLEMNKENIFATENYTRHIIEQIAEMNSGDPKDYVSHPDVYPSSPLLYTGSNNITASLAYLTLNLFSEKHDYSKVIETLQNEIKSNEYDSKCLKEVQRSKILENAYLETLRLWRPVGVFVKFFNSAVVIDKQILPKNTLFAICPSSMLKDPDHWGVDTEIFRPERFEDMGISGKNPKKYPFGAFGLGPRSCPGYAIAYPACLAFFVALFGGDYKFVVDENNPDQSVFRVKSGTNRMPQSFKVKVI